MKIKKTIEQTTKEYTAKFGIDGGISHGFGYKTPDYSTCFETISAENDAKALIRAAAIAFNYSLNHLSNPKTGYTTVTILSLYDNNAKKSLNQKDIVDKYNIAMTLFNFVDDKVTTRCSTIVHLLSLGKK